MSVLKLANAGRLSASTTASTSACSSIITRAVLRIACSSTGTVISSNEPAQSARCVFQPIVDGISG